MIAVTQSPGPADCRYNGLHGRAINLQWSKPERRLQVRDEIWSEGRLARNHHRQLDAKIFQTLQEQNGRLGISAAASTRQDSQLRSSRPRHIKARKRSSARATRSLQVPTVNWKPSRAHRFKMIHTTCAKTLASTCHRRPCSQPVFSTLGTKYPLSALNCLRPPE